MKLRNGLALVLLFVAGLLAGCGGAQSAASHASPATVKPVSGKDLNQLQLTEDAVRRLAIQTAEVREEQIARKRQVGGEVVALPEAATTVSATSAGTVAAPASSGIPLIGTQLSAGQVVLRLLPSGTSKAPIDLKAPRATTLSRMLVAPGQVVEAGQALFETADISTVLVRTPIYSGEVDTIDRGKPAQILPLARGDQAKALAAKLAEQPPVGNARTGTAALYYLVDSPNHGLVPGQRVRVEYALAASAAQQKIVPYASVIYDVHGDTWVYANPAPLTYIREPIAVDYIDADLAVLSQGPAPGTVVVTVGAAELFGAEFGIGK